MKPFFASRDRLCSSALIVFFALGALILAAVLGGCAVAPTSLHETMPTAELQWPAKPYPPRIQWVKTIATDQDAGISPSMWKKLVSLITGPDQRRIVRPHGVLFDDGQLFIADPGGGVVHWMDLKGGHYSIIGDGGDHRLQTPVGLAKDGEDRLYISDSTSGVLYYFDLVHHRLTPFLTGAFQRPTGLAFNPYNNLLYVVDTTVHQVVAVDRNGSVQVRIGAGNGNPGGFNHPTDVWSDSQGKVYVTDPLNYKIKIFTPDGAPLHEFGVAGDVPGALDKPKGIATDSDGHIYVCDSLLDAVQIFDQSGQPLLVFGSPGTEAGEFWMPSGLFIDQRDYIFVVDTYNQRVQVFRYLPAPDSGAPGRPAAVPTGSGGK